MGVARAVDGWSASAIRLASVYVDPGKVAGGDAYFYFNGAKLLLEGHGFINPYYYIPPKMHHQVVQSADFPPLFILAQAVPQAIGLKSFLAARVWCCILGTAAIAVCAYTGREIAGRRVGLITAFLMAVYPNIWMSNELALSEAIAPLLVGTLLLCAYRFWKDPSVKRGIWLGVAMGITMLGRDELSLLVFFLVIPLVLLARSLSWKRRLTVLGIALAGHGARRGALGRVQPEPVPKAGLHIGRSRRDNGLGRLCHHLLGTERGLLVDALRAGLLVQPVVQRAPEGGRRRTG